MNKVSYSKVNSTSLFTRPVPIEQKEFSKTIVVSITKDKDGHSLITHECVEDTMKDLIPLSFEEVTLTNLIDKGVNPKALDMIDTQKLGVDAGVDALAYSIIHNATAYVEQPKFDEK